MNFYQIGYVRILTSIFVPDLIKIKKLQIKQTETMDMNDSDSGIINDLHLADIDIDTAEEYILLVKEVLNDVLPEQDQRSIDAIAMVLQWLLYTL